MTFPLLYHTDFEFRKLLKKQMQFVIEEMEDDGNSLFSALAFLVLDDKTDWLIVRHFIADEIERNRQYYEMRFRVCLTQEKVDVIREGGNEGGLLEITAASRFFLINIALVEPKQNVPSIYGEEEDHGDAIYISLHNGHKFNALLRQ